MCVAILALPGKMLGNKELFSGWSSNPDGGGFAYVDVEGKLKVGKGYMKYGEFKMALDEALQFRADDSPLLVHFRIGTSGTKDGNNTHPFEFTPEKGPKGAMIHNGILFTPSAARGGTGAEKKSDTSVVVSELGTLFELERLQARRDSVGNAIGSNKLAFLFEDKNYVIINEDRGFWEDGIWHSNNSCGVRNYGRR